MNMMVEKKKLKKMSSYLLFNANVHFIREYYIHDIVHRLFLLLRECSRMENVQQFVPY